MPLPTRCPGAPPGHRRPGADHPNPEGNPRLPFLFDAILAKSSWVLVHDGQVIEGGGLAKLGAYLDAIDVYADRALTADDVTDLLYVFQAFPPVDAMAGAPEYYLTEEGTELSVRATWRGHDLDLTLAYRLEAPNVPGLQAGGMTTADSATWQMMVSFWTLHLRKGVLPRRTEERRQITRPSPSHQRRPPAASRPSAAPKKVVAIGLCFHPQPEVQPQWT